MSVNVRVLMFVSPLRNALSTTSEFLTLNVLLAKFAVIMLVESILLHLLAQSLIITLFSITTSLFQKNI